MKTRRVVGLVHLWLGLIAGALVAFVGVTGSLVVFEEELDRLLSPKFFAVADAAGPPLPLADIVGAAEARRPDLVPLRIDFRHMPKGPVVVTMGGTDAPERQVAVDPRTGVAVAERSINNPVGIIWRLHIDLLMGRPGGIIIGVSAIILTVSMLTGLVLWWPRRGKVRQAFTVKRGASPYRLHVDLHRTVGIYLFVPLFVAAVTGIAITWPETTFRALAPILTVPEEDFPPARRVDGARDIGPDEAAAIALARIPSGPLRNLHLPAPDQPFYIAAIRSFENGHPRGRSYAYIYPDDGTVHFWDDTEAAPIGYQIRWEWLLPTHSGDILGLPGKVAMLLAGLAPLLFIVTGTAIWLAKRRARRAVGSRRPGASGADARVR